MITLLNGLLMGEHVPTGMPVLAIGFEQSVYTNGDTFLGAIVIDDDGYIKTLGVGDFRTDWRYNHDTHQWNEVGEIASEEGFADDGSEELPGSVPDPDGGGEGDPLDEEGGSPAGSSGDVDTAEANGDPQ